jgi:hypothetical protein
MGFAAPSSLIQTSELAADGWFCLPLASGRAISAIEGRLRHLVASKIDGAYIQKEAAQPAASAVSSAERR